MCCREITVCTPEGESRKYQVLNLNPFNSKRKRMSLVVQCCETKEIHVMMKGADNKVRKRSAATRSGWRRPNAQALQTNDSVGMPLSELV